MTVGRRDHQSLVVRFGYVIVDCGGSLGAQVTALGVELESADAVGAVEAVELHSTLDALDAIGFHFLNCNLQMQARRTQARYERNEGNAIK